MQLDFPIKDMKIGNKLINARSETASTSGAFKHALKHRRCVIPADGFFEWRKDEQRKYPTGKYKNVSRLK